jgi:hypothetical protein
MGRAMRRSLARHVKYVCNLGIALRELRNSNANLRRSSLWMRV